MPRPAEYDRADVLNRAMHLFWRRGFEAVTLQDILDETGFNRHSLYKEFGDKDGLFTQALEQYEKIKRLERQVEALECAAWARGKSLVDL